MLDLATVQYEIERWIETFVEVPHPSLGGWPPCPYAKKARLERDFDIRLGRDPYWDACDVSIKGLPKSVVIFAYDAEVWSHMEFAYKIEQTNQHWLIPHDMLALEDHPADVEIVNGICMNQGTYALMLVQNLTDLNSKAHHMASKGFYKEWPEEYLTVLFQHRKDPRV
jgi:hypothetical protein